MAGKMVVCEVSSGVARIILNKPPVNALNLEMIKDVVTAFEIAGKDEGIRAVVLTSAVSKAFSAGLDLNILLGKSEEKVRGLLQELYVRLYDTQYNLGKPSIAAVGGAARGGGMTMAISCDVILAGQSATFGYPEIDAGVIPAIHFTHLPRIVGRHRAFELLFSGRSFGAEEGYRLGLVSRVVPDEELVSYAQSLAETFAGKSAVVMRLGRAAFMRQNELGYRRSITNAVEDFCNVAMTDAAQNKLKAFVERRRSIH
ncbi:MAG TPA: enoyl-CoA hydratase/isomerase family protein [Pseudolabrys sp.]|nr:enoyl-CoA hydratase/isomerase family protein [Pseudolabrys sp.]